MAERWLVTGGTGQVGTALRRNPPPGVEIFAPGRDVLNLSALPEDLAALFDGVSALINCGAYTAVDKAETEPDLAEAINAAAPGKLARAADQAGIPIIHLSTDYVFPADSTGPWAEDAPTSPASVYGRTKLSGEVSVRETNARHAIVRTAWVVSADGTNFIKTMLHLGGHHDTVRVVADQRGSPTHAGDLAEVLAAVARRFIADPSLGSGIWHCTNSGETTWHGLATYAYKCAAERGLKVPREVSTIATAEYHSKVKRPIDSRLDCSRLEADFGIALRRWQDVVKEIVATISEEK